MWYIVTESILIVILICLIILKTKKKKKTKVQSVTFSYIRRYVPRMVGGLIIKIVGTVMDLIIPYFLAYIIDNIVPTKNIKLVMIYGGVMILCAAVGFIGSVKANQMASKVASLVTRDLRKDLFIKIQSLSAKELDDVTIPSLVSRMTSDTYNIHHMTGMAQRIGVRAPILLVGGITAILLLDPVMALVLISLLPFLVLVTVIVSKKGIPLFSRIQEGIDDLVQTIRENVTGVRVIKALSKGEYEKKRFDKVNKNLINYELKSGYIMSSLNPITTLLLNFGLVGVIVVGAYRVNGGAILSGKILAFTTYFTIILNAMLTITRIFTIYSKALASSVRIDYVFSLPVDLEIEPSEKVDSEYFIEFNDVSFSYNKKVNNITSLNFKIKKGESLGIVGVTGSGKSTILKLLIREYDVDSGEILINGRNIKSYDHHELTKLFGIVFQNDVLFSTTIRENISFGRNCSDEEIEKASKIAEAYSFIDSTPERFDKVLSAKGINLSGGQRQRVLISRAVVTNPEIIVLDDSSSALDYKTDAKLRKNIRENLDNTTMVIISQRISSIMNCDKILVVDEGKQIGYGKHEELLKNVPLYSEIHHIQMGGGLNE